MRGLLLIHCYTAGKSIRSATLLTAGAVLLLLLLLSNHSMALRVAGFLPFVLIPVQAFEVLKQDALSGWNKYEIILPVSRKKAVAAQYITFLLLVAFSIALVCGVALAVYGLTGSGWNEVFIHFLLRGAGMILSIGALVYPLTYKLGTDRSDSIMMGSVGFSFAVFFGTAFLLESLIGRAEHYDGIFSVVLLLVSALLAAVSCAVSMTIHEKKEY